MIPRDIEGKIIGFCVIILIAFFLAWILSACSGSQKLMEVDVLCVGKDGEIFHAQGHAAQQAGMMDNDWNLHACDVQVLESQEGQMKKP